MINPYQPQLFFLAEELLALSAQLWPFLGGVLLILAEAGKTQKFQSTKSCYTILHSSYIYMILIYYNRSVFYDNISKISPTLKYLFDDPNE